VSEKYVSACASLLKHMFVFVTHMDIIIVVLEAKIHAAGNIVSSI
jgi:hypothetical protein